MGIYIWHWAYPTLLVEDPGSHSGKKQKSRKRSKNQTVFNKGDAWHEIGGRRYTFSTCYSLKINATNAIKFHGMLKEKLNYWFRLTLSRNLEIATSGGTSDSVWCVTAKSSQNFLAPPVQWGNEMVYWSNWYGSPVFLQVTEKLIKVFRDDNSISEPPVHFLPICSKGFQATECEGHGSTLTFCWNKYSIVRQVWVLALSCWDIAPYLCAVEWREVLSNAVRLP